MALVPNNRVQQVLTFDDLTRSIRFHSDFSVGNQKAVRSYLIAGNVASLSANTTVDVTSITPVTLYPFPSNQSTLQIVSTSANDTSAGTGARTAYIEGLDLNYDIVSETVTLNGTTPVVTSNQYLRLNVFNIVSVGSSGYNEGTVTSTHTGTVIGQITPQDGAFLSSVITVPAGYTGYLRHWSANVYSAPTGTSAAKEATFTLRYREPNESWKVVNKGGAKNDGSVFNSGESKLKVFNEKSDIRVRATSLTNGTAISSWYEMYMVLND